MSANDRRLTRAAADVHAETARLEDIEAQLDEAQAAIAREQAALNEIKREQRDPHNRHRLLELQYEYTTQLAAICKAKQHHRELLNCKRLKGS